jgi:hypothetical protein
MAGAVVVEEGGGMTAVVVGAIATVVVGLGRTTVVGAGRTIVVGGAAETGCTAWPELAFTMREDSSTAWKALAGICFNWSTSVSVQRVSAVPWKYQLLPLSARISP